MPQPARTSPAQNIASKQYFFVLPTIQDYGPPGSSENKGVYRQAAGVYLQVTFSSAIISNRLCSAPDEHPSPSPRPFDPFPLIFQTSLQALWTGSEGHGGRQSCRYPCIPFCLDCQTCRPRHGARKHAKPSTSEFRSYGRQLIPSLLTNIYLLAFITVGCFENPSLKEIGTQMCPNTVPRQWVLAVWRNHYRRACQRSME